LPEPDSGRLPAEFVGSRAAVYSAGVETHGVNPRAVSIMEEDGIDISFNRAIQAGKGID